jgi:hypothetical protein
MMVAERIAQAVYASEPGASRRGVPMAPTG